MTRVLGWRRLLVGSVPTWRFLVIGIIVGVYIIILVILEIIEKYGSRFPRSFLEERPDFQQPAGDIDVKGSAGVVSLQADLNVFTSKIALKSFQPYLDEAFNGYIHSGTTS